MEINKDNELLLLIKAKAGLYKEIEECITANHSYDIPEIIELPIRHGLEKYFSWIEDVSR